MARKLLKFLCPNVLCEKRENIAEISENDAKRTRWLLYCCTCGRVAQTEMQVTKDNKGDSWLPCIEYKGAGDKLTRGPAPDDIKGIVWGTPDAKGNLSEEDFIKNYGMNPRIEWCNRALASNNPDFEKICKGHQDRCKSSMKPIVFPVFDPGMDGHHERKTKKLG